MKRMVSFSLKNPFAIGILFVLIIVSGWYSATQFRQEIMPQLSYSVIRVVVPVPGYTTETVNEEITQPLEKQLQTLSNVNNVYSISGPNLAVFNIEYPDGTDMKQAKTEVDQTISKFSLPQEAQSPQVSIRSLSDDMVMRLGILGTSQEQVKQFVQQSVLPELTGIPGVDHVSAVGVGEQSLKITLDAKKLFQHHLSPTTVIENLQKQDQNISGGVVEDNGKIRPIWVSIPHDKLDDLEKITVSGVKLSDVATLEIDSGQQDDFSLINGQNGVEIDIHKSTDAPADVLSITKQVQDRLKQLSFPSGTSYRVIYNQSDDITRSIHGMLNEALLGAIFVILIILLFLRNWRSTLVAAISIPVSILTSFIVLKWANVTLNIMTIGGIAVAVGRVVDDSIVVLENVIRHLRIGNRPSSKLIYEAVTEVIPAVASSTITTIAVFIPLAFISGLVGDVFYPFSMAVVSSLIASFIVAVTLIPVSMKVLTGTAHEKRETIGKIRQAYAKFLEGCLNHKAWVLLVSLFLLVGTCLLFPKLGSTLIPSDKIKYVQVSVELPPTERNQHLQDILHQLNTLIRQQNGVESYAISMNTNDASSAGIGKNSAAGIIKLKPTQPIDPFIKNLKDKAATIAGGADIDISQLSVIGTSSQFQLNVQAPTTDQVKQVSDQVIQALQGIPGLSDVKSNLTDETEQALVEIDPAKADQYGVSTAQLGLEIRALFASIKQDNILLGDQKLPLEISIKSDDIHNLSDLSKIYVPSSNGQLIPLSQVATLKRINKPNVLYHLNGTNYAVITGKVADNQLGNVTTAAKKALNRLHLPAHAEVSFNGAAEQQSQIFSQLGMALLIAMGIVYFVMVVTFGEGRSPFAILFSLPLALIGSILGLFISGEPLSIPSLIGALMLIGIVVTNAIVLIDRAKTQWQQGKSIREALIDAGTVRFRPIWMTALCTMFALLPLALGFAEGGLVSKGLAIVVIGGLFSSTPLTLLVVPVMFELLNRKQASISNQTKYTKEGSV